MKVKTIIDPTGEESVLICAHERSRLVCAIEELCEDASHEILGYRERCTLKLDASAVYCFFCEGEHVYALTDSGKWAVKQRLYQLEEMLESDFCRINQSCLANLRQAKKFDASLSGTLTVTFKNGHRDYVSRRQLKKVKERIGLKK